MAFVTGSGASLRIGKESSFGVAATPNTLVDITSESIHSQSARETKVLY